MIEPGEIRKEWPWVRKGLEAICRRQRCAWIPEDIYAQALHGEITLFVNQERDCFTFMRKISEAHTGEIGVELVVSYISKGNDYDALLDAAGRIAAEAGASYLEMDSQRRFERQGWKIDRVIYRRSL